MNVVPVRKLDHVDQFLRSFTSANTRRAYERDLKEYGSFSVGQDPLAFSTLVQYRDSLISSSAPATVVRKFSAVKSFLGFLASEGLIGANPAANLRVPRSRTLDPTNAFDDVEVMPVIEMADIASFAGSMHRVALILLFNLGLRRSELVNLRLSSFQEHRGIRFVSIIGKSDKSRVLPLTDLVVAELEAYLSRYVEFTGKQLAPEDFLLQSAPYARNSKPVNTATIYRIVTQYARGAGVSKRVSPHSCRATVISQLLEKEVSPRSVADLAGHSSIQTTVGIYDKKRDALTNQAAFKISYERR